MYIHVNVLFLLSMPFLENIIHPFLEQRLYSLLGLGWLRTIYGFNCWQPSNLSTYCIGQSVKVQLHGNKRWTGPMWTNKRLVKATLWPVFPLVFFCTVHLHNESEERQIVHATGWKWGRAYLSDHLWYSNYPSLCQNKEIYISSNAIAQTEHPHAVTSHCARILAAAKRRWHSQLQVPAAAKHNINVSTDSDDSMTLHDRRLRWHDDMIVLFCVLAACRLKSCRQSY